MKLEAWSNEHGPNRGARVLQLLLATETADFNSQGILNQRSALSLNFFGEVSEMLCAHFTSINDKSLTVSLSSTKG